VQEDGVSFNRAANNLQVSGHSVRRWRVALVTLQDPTNPQVRNGAVSHHRGPVGFLDDIQEELIAFVTVWRDCGMPVTRFALVHKIGQLKPAFLEKTGTARLMCISRFLSANNLVHHVATHTAQRPPDEVREDTKMHLVLAVPKCVRPTCDPRFVLNMDQTNLKFGNLPGQTIDVACAPSTCAQALMTASAVQVGKSSSRRFYVMLFICFFCLTISCITY